MRPTFTRCIPGLLLIAATLAALPQAEAATVDRRVDSLAAGAPPPIAPSAFVITRDSIAVDSIPIERARMSQTLIEPVGELPLTTREPRTIRARPTSLPKADDFDHWLFLIPFVGMVALAKDRDTRQRKGDVVTRGVAAGQKIFAGAITVTNATGFVEKGTTALAKKPFGRAKETVDNTAGANGDLNVTVERDGWYCYAGDGSITAADIGAPCFIVDDQTVADTDGAGTRSRLGLIRDVDASGVWVQFD